MTTGTLYGVGTGPGDPQLVTRRAWSLVESAQVIAYPAPDSGESFARSIVAEAISPDAVEIPMVVPMRTGRAPAQSIYDKGAGDIAAHLAAETGTTVTIATAVASASAAYCTLTSPPSTVQRVHGDYATPFEVTIASKIIDGDDTHSCTVEPYPVPDLGTENKTIASP